LTCNGTKIGVHVLHAFQHLFLHKSTDGPLETLERTRISMNRLASFQIKKAKDKDEARARQRRRKEIELEWNRAIRRVIDRYQAATPATIAACLDVNPVPQTPQERTQLRQLYHRLERNALHGRFRALYEYDVQAHGKDIAKAKQRMHAGHVYYVSLEVSRKEGIQYEHKAFIAHTRATLERAIDFDTCKTDTKLRDEAGTEELIFDFYGVKGFPRNVKSGKKNGTVFRVQISTSRIIDMYGSQRPRRKPAIFETSGSRMDSPLTIFW
jgi:hypothetical protein